MIQIGTRHLLVPSETSPVSPADPPWVDRRHLLAAGSGIIAASLAGCSSVPFFGEGDDDHITACDWMVIHHLPEYFDEEGDPEDLEIIDSADERVRDVEPIQRALDRVLDPEKRDEGTMGGEWELYEYGMRPQNDEEEAILDALNDLPPMHEGDPTPGWYFEHQGKIINLLCIENL